MILNALSVAHARMAASFLEPGRFVDGQPVNRASVARLPPWAVGRVLTLGDLESIASGKKNRPPATSSGAGLAQARGD